ncbi:MAG: thiamine pyrophosphate-dependent enzyme [Thermoflexaceae bacterium]|nr:thiamine pyrophosphate-dependent enzyme [Thermoflexaceae bacterium]
MNNQKNLYLNGNEAAAFAAKQINYHIAGYFPITPSTQVVESLEIARSKKEHDIVLIGAEGEHSAAGICYGASACGARVINATSANGLLYALEQLPVQSGTRMPMVMNVACRAVSAPLSIKGDHSDIMFALNTGWLILFAATQQEVYDFNICALKIAETLSLPVIVAYDGFFTSHQKCTVSVLEDETVKTFTGKPSYENKLLDLSNPKTIGAYMNEPFLINNKYQLRLAMDSSIPAILQIFEKYCGISGRHFALTASYHADDAKYLMFALGSSYNTVKSAVNSLRKQNIPAGAFTIHALRPFPAEEIAAICKKAEVIIILDREDSFSATGGNMTLEIKSALYDSGCKARIYSRVYGLGGLDFYDSDAKEIFMQCISSTAKSFDYFGQYPGDTSHILPSYANPISEKETSPALDSFSAMKKRLAPGHMACPGCGIPVNLNILLSAIDGNVVLLFHTGCGMVVTTSYPKTSFKVPYIHNLFQNGPATMTGILAACKEMQRRREYPEEKITFIMVSGDGGMDIGMGSTIAAALRGDGFILFEYDNGGYMNTGYQQSYSTPEGALSSTRRSPKDAKRHTSYKNTPFILAAAGASYVATVAESNVPDFRKKAKKAARHAGNGNFSYIKALSACPLNWGDTPATERENIAAAVNSCYFPLYEIENGKLIINYNPEKSNRKCPVSQWFKYMKRTKYLLEEEYRENLDVIQNDVDERWRKLLLLAEIEF